jgi:hypothetical protein
MRMSAASGGAAAIVPWTGPDMIMEWSGERKSLLQLLVSLCLIGRWTFACCLVSWFGKNGDAGERGRWYM